MARFPRLVALTVGILFLLFGLYAFFAPKAFYDGLAAFAPYNRHFIHDIGAFQIAIGAMLLFAVYARDGLLAALAGASVGQAFHLLSHVIDKDLGKDQGRTIAFLVVLTVVLVAAAFMRARPKP